MGQSIHELSMSHWNLKETITLAQRNSYVVLIIHPVQFPFHPTTLLVIQIPYHHKPDDGRGKPPPRHPTYDKYTVSQMHEFYLYHHQRWHEKSSPDMASLKPKDLRFWSLVSYSKTTSCTFSFISIILHEKVWSGVCLGTHYVQLMKTCNTTFPFMLDFRLHTPHLWSPSMQKFQLTLFVGYKYGTRITMVFDCIHSQQLPRIWQNWWYRLGELDYCSSPLFIYSK